MTQSAVTSGGTISNVNRTTAAVTIASSMRISGVTAVDPNAT